MNTQETAIQNETTASGERQEWPQRFGALKRLQLKNGRKGQYAILTIDCGKFEQVAFAFKAETVAKIKAAASTAASAGKMAQVWVKGPIESVEKNGFEEDQMKVVYFSDNTKYGEAEGAEGEQAAVQPAPVDPDDLTQIKGIGEAVAKALNEAGIETFEALAAASTETLDAIVKGYGARAVKGDWTGQAANLNAAQKELTDEVPF